MSLEKTREFASPLCSGSNVHYTVTVRSLPGSFVTHAYGHLYTYTNIVACADANAHPKWHAHPDSHAHPNANEGASGSRLL